MNNYLDPIDLITKSPRTEDLNDALENLNDVLKYGYNDDCELD